MGKVPVEEEEELKFVSEPVEEEKFSSSSQSKSQSQLSLLSSLSS